MDVNNRVQIALSRLPDDVRRQGVTIRERSPDILQVIAFTSKGNVHDGLWLNNYVSREVLDEIKRVKGVGEGILFGNKDYSIRVWLEPDKLSQYNITAREVSNAIANQNVQISAGIMSDEPLNSKNSFTYNLTTPGRLKTPEEFWKYCVKK